MPFGTFVASAWSAGISLYGVIAAVGIASRLGWITAHPFFEQPAVIAGALALFALELVIDKVAFLDSAWDAVHTVLRPLGGAVIGALAPGQELPVPAMLALGAALSMSSHAAKATTRLLVNASPEPASNVVVSALEDVVVAVVMALAFAFPQVALVVGLVLAVASALFAVVMFRAARRAWRAVRARRERRRAARFGTSH